MPIDELVTLGTYLVISHLVDHEHLPDSVGEDRLRLALGLSQSATNEVCGILDYHCDKDELTASANLSLAYLRLWTGVPSLIRSFPI
jgi:hypothetical protein